MGECAMRKGKGAQCTRSEDWREYREAVQGLQLVERNVKLMIVMGVDGSVSTGALSTPDTYGFLVPSRLPLPPREILAFNYSLLQAS